MISTKRVLLQASVVVALIALAGLGAMRLEFVQDWALLRVFSATTPDADAPIEADALSASVCGSR